MKKKELSIIVPVYNGEKYLEDCLKSIYKQYKDIQFEFEVIIIDDGSKDNSSKIYKKYANKHENIIIIKNSNHGVSYTRNCGIEKATGKYVMFFDCDDLLLDEWYKVVDKYLNSKYDIIMISKYFESNEDSKISKEKVLSYITTYNDENIRISGPYSKLFNLSFLKKNIIKYKENIINGEDMIFCLEAVMKCNNYLLVKDSIYKVRHNRYSSTRNFNEKIITSEIFFNQEISKLFRKYNYWTPEIEKYSFLTSIRCLAYRLGYLQNYKLSKSIYKKIRSIDFYKDGLRRYKYKEPFKSTVLFKLFRHNMPFIMYVICKIKNMKNAKDSFEVL